MDNTTLYHDGVKGMKWGRRRYQNKDGTLTDAGKRRADRDMSELSKKKRSQYEPKPDKWVKEDMERSKRVVDASSRMTSELRKINDNSSRSQTKAKMDLSSMSDKEMRDRINRAMLERQYNDMFAPEKVHRGRAFAKKTLEVAGSALAVTSSALGIALAIKELRG